MGCKDPPISEEYNQDILSLVNNMGIKSISEKQSGLEIDLTGPDGNAYVLLAYAQDFCRQLRYDKFRTECIMEEMRLTDYEGLLHTFDREFGSFVTLWR